MSEDNEIGDAHYVQTLLKRRDRCHEALARARIAFDDPSVAVRSHDDPLLQTHKQLHALVIEYRDQLATYADVLEGDDEDGLWTDVVAEVQIHGRTYNLSLKGVGELSFELVEEVEQAIGDASGSQPGTKRAEVLLPYHAAKATVNQLNKCARELGFIPERYEDPGDAGFDYSDILGDADAQQPTPAEGTATDGGRST